MRIKGKGKSILTRQRLPVLGLFEGLLDQVSGAAAAYSVRLLRASYSGGLVRVRAVNSSGVDQGEADVLPDSNNEISLNSELTNRDSTAGSSNRDVNTLGELVTNTSGTDYDGFVSEWKDQSPNANHATNSTASEQPKIVSAGSLITENGKPALRPDGNNDSLEIKNDIKTSNSSYTMYTVSNIKNNSYFLDSDNGRFIFLALDNENYFDGSGNGVGWTKNKQILAELYLDANNNDGIVYEDGSNIFNGSYSPVSLQGKTAMFSNKSQAQRFFEGTIHELVIWDSFEQAKRNKIKTNINDFYQIPNF